MVRGSATRPPILGEACSAKPGRLSVPPKVGGLGGLPYPPVYLRRPARTVLLAIFALLLAVAGWRTVSAQQVPRIFVEPDVVVGGESVTIRGLDFTPGGYAGLILWDGVWTETLTIPDGGDFSVQFRIPPTANAGKHEVSVCAADARFQCLTGEFAQDCRRARGSHRAGADSHLQRDGRPVRTAYQGHRL